MAFYRTSKVATPSPFVFLVAFCFCSIFVPGFLFANQPTQTKPNIVIFFIDDLGYTDVGAFRKLLRNDESFYETPVMDRLANQAVMFTNFYSGHPVCSPTRAALMTGKAPQRLGITQWINQPSEIHLPLEEETVGEAFANAGYKTGYIGKWHLGDKDKWQPAAQGFNWHKAVNRAGQPASYFHPFQRKKRRDVNYWDVPDLEHAKPGDYLTDHLTDQAIAFIESKSEQPFLLCLSHYAVHTPIQSPEKLVEKYRTKSKQQFTSPLDPIAHTNDTSSRPRQDDARYAAMIENLDDNVGRVLECLNERGLKDNTIVVFTSDNGGLSTLRKGRVGPTSVRPLRAGKGWCYEGGIRVPTMILWPTKFESKVVKVPAITMDLYPTLLELAGLEQKPEQHLDGVSLVKAMNNDQTTELLKRVIGWHYPHDHGSGHTPASAIRKGDWKLIHRTKPVEEFELFNLANDIGETRELAKSHAAKLDEMKPLLKQWLEKTMPANTNSNGNSTANATD